MALRTPTSNLRQREPFFDVQLRTGISFEVFYADRTLETFGRRGAVGFGGLAGAAFRQRSPRLPSSYELRGVSGRDEKQ
jgi:hypothetical protein